MRDVPPFPGPKTMSDPDAEPDSAAAVPLDPSAVLTGPDAGAALAGLDRAALTALTTAAVAAARGAPGAEWVERLQALRSGLLLRNERRLLALCLQGLAETALAVGAPARAVDAADTLWGVRELLDEPWKAHQAMLLLATAQEASGDPSSAEVTLLKALAVAQGLAPGGNVAPASAAAARTLTALGLLLVGQGRVDEGREWLEGALDVAPDAASAEAARRALGR